MEFFKGKRERNDFPSHNPDWPPYKKMLIVQFIQKNAYHTIPCMSSMEKMLIIWFPFMKIVW